MPAILRIAMDPGNEWHTKCVGRLRVRQITDLDIEYLNAAENGPLEFIGWGQWHIKLNFGWISIELAQKFELIKGSETVLIDYPFFGDLPLGRLFGSRIESFCLESGNRLVADLDDESQLRMLPEADRQTEQFVISVQHREPEEGVGFVII